MSLTLNTQPTVHAVAVRASAEPFEDDEALPPERLRRAKKAYTTRFLAAELELDAGGYTLRRGPGVTPVSGDVVLARIEQIGLHRRLESPESRRQTLFLGDEILVAFGNRYAPDQFMAYVPQDLADCQLVAGGGVAGVVMAQHSAVLDATVIRPLGLLADENGVVNIQDRAPFSVRSDQGQGMVRPPVIAVLGTSMNSGKTTSAACLMRGLANAGLCVAAGKVTGTGSGNDPRLFMDAGASPVLDFTDFGIPTTFRQSAAETRELLKNLIAALASSRPDVIVLEIADGLYQEETRRLLHDPVFHGAVDHVVFCAMDALGAVAGLEVLKAAGLPVTAVSGRLTASPLATAEAAEVLTVPVLETFALCEQSVASALMPSMVRSEIGAA